MLSSQGGRRCRHLPLFLLPPLDALFLLSWEEFAPQMQPSEADLGSCLQLSSKGALHQRLAQLLRPPSAKQELQLHQDSDRPASSLGLRRDEVGEALEVGMPSGSSKLRGATLDGAADGLAGGGDHCAEVLDGAGERAGAGAWGAAATCAAQQGGNKPLGAEAEVDGGEEMTEMAAAVMESGHGGTAQQGMATEAWGHAPPAGCQQAAGSAGGLLHDVPPQSGGGTVPGSTGNLPVVQGSGGATTPSWSGRSAPGGEAPIVGDGTGTQLDSHWHATLKRRKRTTAGFFGVSWSPPGKKTNARRMWRVEVADIAARAHAGLRKEVNFAGG